LITRVCNLESASGLSTVWRHYDKCKSTKNTYLTCYLLTRCVFGMNSRLMWKVDSKTLDISDEVRNISLNTMMFILSLRFYRFVV